MQIGGGILKVSKASKICKIINFPRARNVSIFVLSQIRNPSRRKKIKNTTF